MADTKISGLSALTDSTLASTDALVANRSGDQDYKIPVSEFEEYQQGMGALTITSGVTAQDVSTQAKINQWLANGAVNRNTTVDHTADEIQVSRAGLWLVKMSIRFQGGAGNTYTVVPQIDTGGGYGALTDAHTMGVYVQGASQDHVISAEWYANLDASDKIAIFAEGGTGFLISEGLFLMTRCGPKL